MEYANAGQRRIIGPPPPVYDAVTGALLFPVGAPGPGGYFVRQPVYRQQPVVVVGHPVRLSPRSLSEVDQERTRLLVEFMDKEGLLPSAEDEARRRGVVEQLQLIALDWIRRVALQRQLPIEACHVTAVTKAMILPFGSYGLGVHGSDSDIDALCVGPYFATLEDDFFGVLCNMLQNRPEVSELHCVKTAKVPLMRFKFSGVLVDFPYAQLRVASVPDVMQLHCLFSKNDSWHLSRIIADETSWRSLSGVRVNTRIRQLVPNLENFQAILRCIKLWARRRGIYSHLLGFYGGIHLTILAAYVCQKYPDSSISALLVAFFKTFSHWPWPFPVILQSLPFRHPDGRCHMPIMMPCDPFEWCGSNVTRSTSDKIKAEFWRACIMTNDPGRMGFQWDHVFLGFPYATTYSHFIKIFLCAPDADELQDWVGWVKSRFRGLLLKLEIHGFCDPNPTEYVDHTVSEPNTVFYWGLSSDGVEHIDTESVKEDFMRSVNKDLDSDTRSTRAQCELELSIVPSSELPKNIEIDSGSDNSGSRNYWRVLNELQMRRPVHPQRPPRFGGNWFAP